MAKRITDRVADKLQVGEKIFDTTVTGFGVRRQKKETVFFVRYKSPTEKSKKTGKPLDRYRSVGTFNRGVTADMARTKALEILGQVSQGVDPTAESKRMDERSTVGRYITRYLKHKIEAGGREQTIRSNRRYLEAEVSELLGRKQIDEVTPKDIYELFEHTVAKRSIAAANVCYDCVRAMFNYSIRRYDLSIANPCRMTSKERLRHKLVRRECILTDEQVGLVASSLDRAQAAGRITATVADCIRLIALTGLRRLEAMSLKWAYVDMANGVLNLPNTKTGPSERVLNDAAWEFLRKLKAEAGQEYVFPGNRPASHIQDIYTGWHIVRQDAGLPDMRLHDWRHNFASRMAQQGVSGPLIMKLGGWKNLGTMQRYLKFNEHAALRQAANKAVR